MDSPAQQQRVHPWPRSPMSASMSMPGDMKSIVPGSAVINWPGGTWSSITWLNSLPTIWKEWFAGFAGVRQISNPLSRRGSLSISGGLGAAYRFAMISEILRGDTNFQIGVVTDINIHTTNYENFCVVELVWTSRHTSVMNEVFLVRTEDRLREVQNSEFYKVKLIRK
jgi:hypothetical protein